MCLIAQDINGQLPKELVPMKAKKDIVVYKMLECATIEDCLSYSYKKIYHTPYMCRVVKFNLFDRCVMKTDKMTGEYITAQTLSNSIYNIIGSKRTQHIEWINGENVSNVMRSNDIGINDKETLYVSEGIHAYTKIPRKRFSVCGDHCEFHKAIIPQGSYYFVDEVNDEIVADKMIIFKKALKS